MVSGFVVAELYSNSLCPDTFGKPEYSSNGDSGEVFLGCGWLLIAALVYVGHVDYMSGRLNKVMQCGASAVAFGRLCILEAGRLISVVDDMWSELLINNKIVSSFSLRNVPKGKSEWSCIATTPSLSMFLEFPRVSVGLYQWRCRLTEHRCSSVYHNVTIN